MTRPLATPPTVQRERVQEDTRLVEFSAGHNPFLSRPDHFARNIAAGVRED